MANAFQSLFYWITYSYIEFRTDYQKIAGGFNPYFIGLTILITWDSIHGRLFSSFNTYFIGLTILISTNPFESFGVYWFQSLFYWITYSYIQALLAELESEMEAFQSLFYWITYSYGESLSLINMVKRGFNPYFIGLPILIV